MLSTAEQVIERLAPLDLKETARGHYRCHSPLREKSDSGAFTLKIDDDEHGVWFDHVSGEQGSLYQLANKLGIETPLATRNETTKRGYDGLDDYARTHHVPADVLRQAGWNETTYKSRPALAFPTASGTRWRFLDGETPPYLNPRGYQACWYGLEHAARIARESGQPLAICNGEASTVAAQHAGVAACCVTSGEKGSLPETLLVELWEQWQGPILVAFDCDEPGQTKAPKLAAQLRDNGWPATRAVDLQGGIEGYDLADLIGRYGRMSAQQLSVRPSLPGEPDPRLYVPETPATKGQTDHQQPDEHPAFRIYSITELWDHQAGVQKAWGGWMLMNNITLIGGVPSVGKSPLLLALAAGYLRGLWPDGTPVPAEMAGRSVIYMLPEGYGEQTEILLNWGFTREELAQRIFIPALPTPGAPEQPTYTFKLDQGQGMELLHYYCQQTNPALIIIDGLRAAMTGEESASGDVDRFYSPLVQLTRQYNAATVLSHHLTKGSETASREGTLPSMDWFRGSGHITSIPRSAWIVDQPDPTNLEMRRITLVKAAAGPKGQMMAFRMGDPADGVHFEQAIPLPPPRNKKEAARRFILQMLRRGPLTHEELWQAAQQEGVDCSAATFRDARVELSGESKIVASASGHGGGLAVRWSIPGLPDPQDKDIWF